MWASLHTYLISEAGLDLIARIARAAVWLVVGLPLVFALSRAASAYLTRRVSAQHGLIAGKVIFLAGMGLVAASVFFELGFSLGPLLGTAGVVGVAVGFAAQTSLSNLISGIFLMTEQHFVVGDVITVGDTTGQVLSIDLMSVKIRAFDNKFVRIPNETIVKSQVTNITHFPIRRVDLAIGVAYKEDLGRVREVLMEVAARNPLCLMEPEPLFIIDKYADSAINLLFLVWAEMADWLAVKNSMMQEIKERFDAEGIEIPFPHVTLYAGSVTGPMPVQVVAEKPQRSSK